jgi:hypothetical protein
MGQFSAKNPCRPGQLSVEINSASMPGDDNRLPTLDVIKKFGEGESWPQRPEFRA